MVTPQHILTERAQLARIDKLNEDVRYLKGELDRIERRALRYKKFHDYWQSILDACKASEVVASEFCRFMVAVKLCIDEPIEGLTTPEKDDYCFGQLDLFDD